MGALDEFIDYCSLSLELMCLPNVGPDSFAGLGRFIQIATEEAQFVTSQCFFQSLTCIGSV